MARTRDRRPGFSRRAQYGLFFTYVGAIAGAMVGAVLLVISTFNPPAFSALRSGFTDVTAPVSGALVSIARGIVAIPLTVETYFAVHGENARLRARIAQDRALVSRARTIGYDNRRLRALLRLHDGDDTAVVTTRIVSSSASSTRRFGILGAGTLQGVREGQPVRGPDGLIGRVVETGFVSARVLLVTDPESVVPVRRARDGRPALASGRGDGLLDVRAIGFGGGGLGAGDVLVTSGTGGIYPPGVPVARIRTRTRDALIAAPFAAPDTLDFAIVDHPFLPPPPPPRQAVRR